jgi:hypothetical protein
MIKRTYSLLAAAALVTAAAFVTHAETKDLPKDVKRVAVVFSGGYDTDPRDKGRPVVLVAGALGVKPEVFRDAFSRVHPAGPGSGGPTEAEARKNKDALMSVLGKYGITNERLDTVSNRYRYMKSKGEMWTHKPADVTALVKDGTVISYEINSAGYGYSSVPTITVPGIKDASAKVELAFSKDFEKNGSISSITPVRTK